MCEKGIYCLLLTVEGVVNIFLPFLVWGQYWSGLRKEINRCTKSFRRLAHFWLILLCHIRWYFTFIAKLFFIFFCFSNFWNNVLFAKWAWIGKVTGMFFWRKTKNINKGRDSVTRWIFFEGQNILISTFCVYTDGF
jgi:hypothetical protein